MSGIERTYGLIVGGSWGTEVKMYPQYFLENRISFLVLNHVQILWYPIFFLNFQISIT